MGSQKNAPLPDGLTIHGYKILRKIASGGFSIVYLAEDEAGERFAIKEYLPSNLVQRVKGELEPTVLEKNLGTFRNGLKCFFEEGRALAQIYHPNVVRVLNFFRANGTVYMVMAFEKGRSLQEIILRYRKTAQSRQQDKEATSDDAAAAGPDGSPAGKSAGKVARTHDKTAAPKMPATFDGLLAERHIIHVFNQVMSGLREVHANRILHLDIKPANIYLRLDGTPLLLDFGAARRTLDAGGPKLFPMYTPGFAAPELYRRGRGMGPWTDVYSIGTSMYACMAGLPPQAADLRRENDKLPAAIERLSTFYSQALLDIVLWCVKLDPIERPQSVFALQRALRAIELPEPERKFSRTRWFSRIWRNTTSDAENEQHSIILPG
ncbi:MAG: serine/threonine-protein kinase [Burkholderiaceae bacterium]